VEFEGHACEVQLQCRPFYDLKKGQHKVYEVVRSLQIEGGLAEIPEAASVPLLIRAVVFLLLLFSGAAGLWQSTLFRFYNWCSFGTWNANQDTADPHAAVLMIPFLMLFYVSLARVWRSLRCHSWGLVLAGQAASAVGIIVFGLQFDPAVLSVMPDAAWNRVTGVEGLWSQESYTWFTADETLTHLKDPEREENFSAVLIPHVMVGLLFLRDLASTLRWKGAGTRPRSRVGMLCDEFLGPRGVHFEHRLVVQQLTTVALQATQKLPVLGAAAWSVDVTRSPVLDVDSGVAKVAHWITVAALVVNALHPAVLLQWARPATQRTASMGLDAALDIVHFSTFSVSMHRVVGAASAPSNIAACLATFCPAFHAFSAAIGLELSAMQDGVLTEEARTASLAKALARKKLVLRPVVWGMALLKLGIVAFALFYLCGDTFPVKTNPDGRCDPCECRDDDATLLDVVSCDAVALTLPNEFYFFDRGIATIGGKVFENPGFDGVTVVDLSDNPISSVHSLPPSLQHLDLSRRGMDENAVASVAAALKETNGRLTDLVLRENSIGADGAAAIATSLMSASELSVLDLDYNSIGVEGAMALALMLKGRSKLAQLGLDYNNLGDDGAAAIAEALMQAMELSHLALNFNNIGVDGTMAVAAMLEDKSKLSQLRLQRNNLGDDGAAAIAEALMQATELSLLNLYSCNIGVNGTMAVAEMLTDKSKLSQLILAGNNLGDDGAAAIAEALMQATELSILDLDSSNIGVNGTMALAAMLTDKSKLSQLYLERNNLGDDVQQLSPRR
jgi:hypothetical protein